MADSDGLPIIVGAGAIWTSYRDGDVLGTNADGIPWIILILGDDWADG